MSLCGEARWRPLSNPAFWQVFVGTLIVVVLWGAAVVTTARGLLRGNRMGLPAAPTSARISGEALTLAVWGVGSAVVVWHWWRRRSRRWSRLLALFGAAALALGLSAAQLLPAIEFAAS